MTQGKSWREKDTTELCQYVHVLGHILYPSSCPFYRFPFSETFATACPAFFQCICDDVLVVHVVISLFLWEFQALYVATGAGAAVVAAAQTADAAHAAKGIELFHCLKCTLQLSGWRLAWAGIWPRFCRRGHRRRSLAEVFRTDGDIQANLY